MSDLVQPPESPTALDLAHVSANRYKVIEGSQSGHCCFDCTVVDTDSPHLIHGEQFNGQFEALCECFDAADAKAIRDALNAYSQQRMVRCRDCAHWLGDKNRLAEYSREIKPEDGWQDGVCPVLLRRLDITASGGWNGATVVSVETDANFGCIYGEAPNAQDQTREPKTKI